MLIFGIGVFFSMIVMIDRVLEGIRFFCVMNRRIVLVRDIFFLIGV